MTPADIAACTGAEPSRALAWSEPLLSAMQTYAITTPLRQAAFLAQVGHESGGLRYAVELWGPTPAQQRYEGRAELGNTQPGDGYRYRGRGLLQTTGRANYAAVRNRLRARLPQLQVPDFVAAPEQLAAPRWAAYSATDYWDMRGLNALADSRDLIAITQRINGGQNGYARRAELYAAACAALGLA